MERSAGCRSNSSRDCNAASREAGALVPTADMVRVERVCVRFRAGEPRASQKTPSDHTGTLCGVDRLAQGLHGPAHERPVPRADGDQRQYDCHYQKASRPRSRGAGLYIGSAHTSGGPHGRGSQARECTAAQPLAARGAPAPQDYSCAAIGAACSPTVAASIAWCVSPCAAGCLGGVELRRPP
jgi:hypothetical protein